MILIRTLEHDAKGKASKCFKVTRLNARRTPGDGEYIVHEPAELGELPDKVLVALYNDLTQGSQIQRFSDRVTGLQRTWALLTGHVSDEVNPQFTMFPNQEGTMSASENGTTQESTAARKSGSKSARKSAAKGARKSAAKGAKKSGEKAAPKEKSGPGVIGTIALMMERKNGASVNEIMERLTANFPDRQPDSMIKTARIQVRRLYKSRGVKAPEKFITDDEKRGRVYHLPSEK